VRLALDGADAFALRGSAGADFRYLTGVTVEDGCFVLVRPDETLLFVASLEVGRARDRATVDRVVPYERYADGDVRGDLAAETDALRALCRDEGVESLVVPPAFPVLVADRLREAGVAVAVRDAVAEARVVKGETEVDHLRAAQRATEAALREVRDRLRASAVGGDGVLHAGGDPVTADRVRGWAADVATDRGAVDVDAIVAPGPQAADPHARGEGPLRADEPVVVDVFPRFESGYHGDATRTFVVGDAPPAVREMHETQVAALRAALDAVRAGATGEAVHDAACDVVEAAGYETLRTGAEERGFVHSTGHAVGLDLHEQPRLTTGAGPLPAGAVLTVEPGIYEPGVGAVRTEDMVVVREDGCENLNELDHGL
jgi:Xaa-Pro aminopeptidase